MVTWATASRVKQFSSTATIALLMSATAAFAAAEQPQEMERTAASEPAAAEQVQEIVVTGSRIPRSDGIPPASPLEILSATQLEKAAPTTVASFLKDLPSNFGSTFSSGRGFGGGDTGIGTVNLRGLGASATLVLVNGQRTTPSPIQPDSVTDVNTLVPMIMVDRVEVVKDGASALYGSDAVSGVVNFVTNSRFEGLRVQGRVDDFTYSNKGDRRIEAMFGSALGDRGHFVAAASYTDQDAMFIVKDVPLLDGQGSNPRYSSPSSNPGTFTVPTRNAAGALTTTNRTLVDPTCGQVTGTFPSNGKVVDGIAVVQAAVDSTTTQCRYLFYLDQASQAAIKQFQAFSRFDYKLFDNVSLQGDFGYSVASNDTYFVAGAPMSLTNLVVPGHAPGNIYRATNAAGAPLYAVSSGVSAGYSRDGSEVFLPARNTAGQVVLTSNPTDPASGIPFYEDVRFTGRAVGMQCGLPTGNQADPGACSLSRPSHTDSTLLRSSLGLSGSLFETWNWNAGLTYSHSSVDTNGASPGTALATQLRNALQGLGGPNCTGATPGKNGCLYYNIFGNNTFATAAGDPRANQQAVLDYVFPLMVDRYDSTLLVAEGSVAGLLPGLAAGDIGVALGYQIRQVNLTIDYDINKNIRNDGTNTVFYDINKDRTTKAVYGEIRLPIIDGPVGYAELSGAVRNERGSGYSTTNPKIGLLYRTPNGILSLRSTYGTSFVAPSLFRLYSVSGTSGTVNDVCANPVCTGAIGLVTQVQTQGNANLRPETSKNFNIGFTVAPLTNLSLSLDWWNYNFSNRIATETPQSVLLSDPTGALTGRVIRGANGQVVQINAQYFNAARVETSGFDMIANYKQSLGEWGDFATSLSASYVPVYRWQLTSTAASINYAGRVPDNNVQNSLAGIASSPKWHGLLNLNWARGPHSVNLAAHYTSGFLFNKNGAVTAGLNENFHSGSWTPVDITYSFSPFEDRNDGVLKSLKVQAGAVNLFDAAVPQLPPPALNAFVATAYDTRGRMVWTSVSIDF